MKTANENMTCTSKQLFVLLNDLKEGKLAGECRIDDTLANQKLKETLQQDQFDITANLLNRMDSPPSRVDFMPLHRLITEEEVDDVVHAVKDVLPTGQFTSGFCFFEQKACHGFIQRNRCHDCRAEGCGCWTR